MRDSMATRFIDLIRRAGWWGTGIFAGACFFLVGGLVSLLDGDFRIALQSLLVTCLLGGITYYLIHRSKVG